MSDLLPTDIRPKHPVLCRSALITPQGYALGTLCVIDREPRQLQPQQVGFADFKSPVAQLELHRNLANVVSGKQELELAQEHYDG